MLNIKILQMFGIKLNKYEYFSPTWSCGQARGSETQPQVGENLNYIARRFNSQISGYSYKYKIMYI